MSTNVIGILQNHADNVEQSKMETVLLTPVMVKTWTLPPFQRPLTINAKIKQIAAELKTNGGMLQGVISLGTIGTDPTLYLYDGQHRIEAAMLSELSEFIADVRICQFANMAEMADAFVKLNTQISRLRPDDVLRGLEPRSTELRAIRQACPFINYRVSGKGGTVSMAVVLRSWFCSIGEAPSAHYKGKTAAQIVIDDLTPFECNQLIEFLTIAREAWSDGGSARLWGQLNLTMCMWMWRVLVKRERASIRHTKLTPEGFKKCLMRLAASSDYCDWLSGRHMNDRDRSPAYARIKSAFNARLREDDGINNPVYPKPSWATAHML